MKPVHSVPSALALVSGVCALSGLFATPLGGAGMDFSLAFCSSAKAQL